MRSNNLFQCFIGISYLPSKAFCQYLVKALVYIYQKRLERHNVMQLILLFLSGKFLLTPQECVAHFVFCQSTDSSLLVDSGVLLVGLSFDLLISLYLAASPWSTYRELFFFWKILTHTSGMCNTFCFLPKYGWSHFCQKKNSVLQKDMMLMPCLD